MTLPNAAPPTTILDLGSPVNSFAKRRPRPDANAQVSAPAIMKLRSFHSISSRFHIRAVIPNARSTMPPTLPTAVDERSRLAKDVWYTGAGCRRIVLYTGRASGGSMPKIAPEVKPRWRQWTVRMVRA
ncbi:MAG: hypothetical protein LQ350_008413 [Teloschistes chrysophthalmus]|nr:MAG: hypothetical protein LQ350_008413 [Niorma chrysophthalma]